MKIVKFETAKLAKEIKFFRKCTAYYKTYRNNLRVAHKSNPKLALENWVLEDNNLYGSEPFWVIEYFQNNGTDSSFITAPTQSQLHQYLIDEYKIYINVYPNVNSFWNVNVINIGNKEIDCSQISKYLSDYNSNTEAMEIGLARTLELLKKYEK